jgi:translation initiation factor IF-3
MKQMRFGLKIGDHDLGFLGAGHKVKITLFFRGRELAHKDIGFKLADRVINDFGDAIAVDQQPQLNGKQLSFVIRGTGKPVVKHSEPAKTEVDTPVTVQEKV